MIIEIIGTLSSIIILMSFLFSDLKVIRVINIIGSVVFIVYGILINSFSICFLNIILVIVHIVKLLQERRDYNGKRSNKTKTRHY